MKFFHKSSSNNAQDLNNFSQNLNNGDEKTLLKYNTLMDEKQRYLLYKKLLIKFRFYSTNPFSLNEKIGDNQQINSISRRRAPPPPYEKHFCSPIYVNASEMTNNQQNFKHQRGYSEQDYNKVSF